MRNSCVNLPNRCYHLISRVAHRAFFLDDEERTRLVDLIRRVSRFSGVKLLAYGVMSNHFHVTDPDHPNSPRQKYALTKAGVEKANCAPILVRMLREEPVFSGNH